MRKFLVVMVVVIALYFIMLLMTINSSELNTGKLLDLSIMLVPIYQYLRLRKVAKNWKGQFIEWTENQLSYKTRQKDITTLPYDEISGIEIKLDEIIFSTKDSLKFNLIIGMRIKDKFKAMQNCIH